MQPSSPSISRTFPLAKLKLCPLKLLNSPFPSPPIPGNYHSTFSLLWIWPLLGACYKQNHIEYLFFCDWLSSFSMSSRFIHIVACVRILRLSNVPLWIYIHHILFLHSKVSRHLGSLHLLAVLINAAVNMGVQIGLQVPALNSGYVPKCGISGS